MISKKRLEHLKTVLASIPEENFDITNWIADRPCGTVCCAMGWACQDPVFEKQGLFLAEIGTPGYKNDKLGGIAYGPTAIEIFFNINESQRLHIFYGLGYSEETEHSPQDVTPLMVIDHIDDVLQGVW